MSIQVSCPITTLDLKLGAFIGSAMCLNIVLKDEKPENFHFSTKLGVFKR